MVKNITSKIILKVLVIILVFFVIVTGIMYGKYEDARYAFNINCYYRLEDLQGSTNEIVKKLNTIKVNNKASIVELTEIMYLHSIVKREQWYLSLSLHDYEWKIRKIAKPYEEQSSFGINIDLYFDYIMKVYKDKVYIDYEKETKRVNLVCKYYGGIQQILNKKTESIGNTGSLDKHDIITKENWIELTSDINKYDKSFREQHANELATLQSK